MQRRFHELVTSKLADAHRQIDELTAFTAQLDAAAARLAGPAADGPCVDGCACATTTPPGAHAPAAIAATPSPRQVSRPIACTLTTHAAGARVDEWHAALRHARNRVITEGGGTRIELDDAADIAELSRLVAAEQQCCSFSAFALTVDRRGVGLEVEAAADVAEVVAAMFGPPRDREE